MNIKRDVHADLYGVDGCKAGWFVAKQCGRTGTIATKVIGRFEDLLEWKRANAIVAVDMPIGLSSNGVRTCDTLARKILGRPRASSVFTPPIRAALVSSSYEEACAVNQAVTGKRISIQAFHIRNKIAEVDDMLRTLADEDVRVFEVHPELSFMHLRMEQGGPAHGLRESKAIASGRRARRIRGVMDRAPNRFGNDIPSARRHRVRFGKSSHGHLLLMLADGFVKRIRNTTASTAV